MADFDVNAAKAAGYSDEDISRIVNGIKAARAAGYSDDEIREHIQGMKAAQPPGEAAEVVPPSVPSTPPPTSSAQPSLLSSAAREAAITGSGLLKGATNVLALPSTLKSIINSHLPTWAQDNANVLGLAAAAVPGALAGRGPSPDTLSTPLVSQIQTPLSAAGLINNPSLHPANSAENYLSSAAEGVGGILPTLPFGGGIPALASGAAGGLASEAAHEAFPNSSAAPIIAGTVAGMGVGGAASLLGGNPLEKVAASLGSSSTMQQAGGVLQDAVRDWKANILPMKINAAAAPLDAKMAHNPDIPLTTLDSTIQDMAHAAGKAKPVSDLFTSKLPSQVESALQRVGGPQISTPGGASFTLPTIPYQDARQLRSDIGAVFANPKLIPNADMNKLKAIYGSLSADIGKVAAANGAADDWNNFNETTNALYKKAEGPMSKIASDTNPSNDSIDPGQAAVKLVTGQRPQNSGSDLQALREEVPYAVDELAAAHLRTNPNSWLKLSPEAKSALISDPEVSAQVDKLAGIKPTSPQIQTAHGIGALLSGQVGDWLGGLITDNTGIPPHALALAAAATPMIARGAKDIVKNPERLKFPALGALGAEGTKGP